ncbi:MAG: hypothetical protein WD055_03960 [Candidatus Dependentiae bacterium]
MEEHAKKLTLNVAAVEHARKLIQEGKVNRTDDWASNNPDAHAQNAYLDNHSFADYGKWFLATNNDSQEDVKEHYEFPYGNFNEVFRSGLIAAKQRAGQFKHTEIEQAASMLLAMLEK